MAPEVVGFPVSPVPLLVPVGLVAGDQDCRFDPGSFANALENVDHSHRVDLERVDRIVKRPEDEGLGREVEDRLGSERVEHIGETLAVPDVAQVVRQTILHSQQVEYRRIGRNAIGVSDDLGAEVL